ncbi:MAG: NAD(P)/FAD-dependent oxidoreductase [Acidobacteriota bacterium]
MPDIDVLVVGGGPAGLATAIAARRKGLSVTVVDAAVPPIDKACGEGLMPDALRALADLGVEIPPGVGAAFYGIRFVGEDVSVEAEFPTGFGLALRRTALHQILVDAAGQAGVELHWGAPASELSNVKARWIIGADGHTSRVRKWAGLDRWRCARERLGFRVHYQVTPWADHVEVYWHPEFQMYVAGVAVDEVMVAVLCHDPHIRVEDALDSFPELRERLGDAPPRITMERGGVSATRRLWVVTQGGVALVGDAAGSVDAITGEGLGLAFRQALALADALVAGNLDFYEAAHRRLMRRPTFMADLLLLLDGRPNLQYRALHYLARHPNVFRYLLALHVGQIRNPLRYFEGHAAAALGAGRSTGRNH